MPNLFDAIWGSADPSLEMCRSEDAPDVSSQIAQVVEITATQVVLPLIPSLTAVASEQLGNMVYSIGEGLYNLKEGIKEFFSPWFAESAEDCQARLKSEIPEGSPDVIARLRFAKGRYENAVDTFQDADTQLQACKQRVKRDADRGEHYLKFEKTENPYEDPPVSHPKETPPISFPKDAPISFKPDRENFIAQYADKRCEQSIKGMSRDDTCIAYRAKNAVKVHPCSDPIELRPGWCWPDTAKAENFVAAAKEVRDKMQDVPGQIFPQIFSDESATLTVDGREITVHQHTKSFPCGPQHLARELALQKINDPYKAWKEESERQKQPQRQWFEEREKKIAAECSEIARHKRAFSF